MTLKEWRKINRYTQDGFAAALQAHVKNAKKLRQRTVGSWELGHMPRPFWLEAIGEFTKKKVTSLDFPAKPADVVNAQ